MVSYLPFETALNGKNKHFLEYSELHTNEAHKVDLHTNEVYKVDYIEQQHTFTISYPESFDSTVCDKNETSSSGPHFSGLATVSSDSSCTFNGQVLSLTLGLDHSGKILFTTSQLSLQRGTIYGLVGKNGTGKSSLAKILASKTLPGFPQYLTTEYLSPNSGTASSDCSEKLNVRDYMLTSTKRKENEIEKQIIVLEERFEEAVDQNIDDAEFEALSSRIGELYDLKDELVKSSEQKVDQMLDQLGFKSANMLDTAVEHLSSGWKYKCQLATTFLTQPDLIVIDEPSYLDVNSIEWFLKQIKQIAKASNSIVVLISHKELILERSCDAILFINPVSKTLLVYSCTYKNFMIAHGRKVISAERAISKATKQNESAKKSLDNFKTTHVKICKASKKFIAQSKNKTHDKQKTGRAQGGGGKMKKHVAAKQKLTEKKEKNTEESNKSYMVEKCLPISFAGEAVEGISDEKPILSMQNVSFSYEKNKPVLTDVSAQVRAKDKILFQGRNGQGKSTLVKLLLEELIPESGSTFKHNRCNITYFPQIALETMVNEHGTQTSSEFLKSFDANLSETVVRTHLGKFGIKGDLATRPVATLSSGQQVRLHLAKETLLKGIPTLLIMDEVTENLDIESVDSFLEALIQFPAAVLCISHDQYFIDRYSSAITQKWMIRDGNLKVDFI